MLKTHNAIPYFLIVIMGLLIYILWSKYTDERSIVERQQKEIASAYETIASVQAYNEQRFEELTRVRDRRWKRGKHKDNF